VDGELYYKVMIGPGHQAFYLKHFARFDDGGRARMSWHWPAFFATSIWLLYRKMWACAAVYLVAQYIVMASSEFVQRVAGGNIAFIAEGAWLLATFIVPPLFANALYHRHCKNKIDKARGASDDMQRQLVDLAARGGTSAAAAYAVSALLIVFVLGVATAIFVSAYRGHTLKEQLVSDVGFGMRAAQSIGRYYTSNHQFPESLYQTGFREHMPDTIATFHNDAASGVIRMSLLYSNREVGSLLLVPSVEEGDRVSWHCVSEDLDEELLPEPCEE